MARERIVTRTIITTIVEVTLMNVESKNITSYELEVTGKLEDEKELAKAVAASPNNMIDKDERIVMCKAVRYDETLYGMPEADFIRYAEILPARGTKQE